MLETNHKDENAMVNTKKMTHSYESV